MSVTVAWILDLGSYSEIKSFHPRFLGEPGSNAKENKLPPFECVQRRGASDEMEMILIPNRGNMNQKGKQHFRRGVPHISMHHLVSRGQTCFSLGVTMEFSSRN